MIFNLFNAALRPVRRATASLSKAFAVAVCPATEKPALVACYHNVDLLEERIRQLAAARSDALWDVAEILDVMDETDSASYNALAAILTTKPGESEDLPESDDFIFDSQLVRCAQGYLSAYDQLTPPLKAHLRRSLTAQTDHLMHIVRKAVEQMDEDDDNDFDDNNDSGPTPRL